MASLPVLRPRHLALAPAAAGALLCAQVAWVVHRDLPSFEGFDISGIAPASAASAGGAMSGGGRLRVVALGDSTLTGPGLAGPEEVWLWQALERLDLPEGIEVRSLAVGGSRVIDVLRRVGPALDAEPDLVVVAVGSNDAIHATPRQRFARDVARLLDELGDAPTSVAVANVGDLGNLERVPRPLSSVLRARSRTIRAEIERAVAARDGVHLLDVSSSDEAFRRGGVFVGDRFHPDAIGHRCWAEAALEGLGAAVADARRVRARR